MDWFFLQSRYFFVGVVVSSTRHCAFQNPVCSKKQFSWSLASTRWDFAAQTSMDSRWQHTTVTKKSSYFCIQNFLFYIRMVLKMESWFLSTLKTGSWSGIWFWCRGLILRVGTRRISLKYLHKNGMLSFEGYMCWTWRCTLPAQAIPVLHDLQSFDHTMMLGKCLHQLFLPSIHRNRPRAFILLWHNCLIQSKCFLYLEGDAGASLWVFRQLSE